jgi:hypothetical protein
MRFGNLAVCLVGSFVALAVPRANASQTVAPPDLQQTILGIFPQSAKCGKSVSPKVLSSKKGESGEIEELWQVSTCDTHAQIRYLIRLAPGKSGALEVIGFERAR